MTYILCHLTIAAHPRCTLLYGHSYADDVLIYIFYQTKSIQTWMQTNFLQPNYNKSDMIIIGLKFLPNNTHNFSLSVNNSTLSPSATSVIIDSNLTLEKHISQITRTAFFHLINIARLCPSLSFSAAETLIYAFIASRIDYTATASYMLYPLKP